MGKLRELGDINSAIREQKAKLAEIEKQASDSNHQKQEIDVSLKTTGFISDYRDAQIFYLNWFFRLPFQAH